MNSFDNSVNVTLGEVVTSNTITVSYDEWETGYTPSEVWVVVPQDTKWSVDSGPFQFINSITDSVVREDDKVEVRLPSDYLNNKTLALTSTAPTEYNTWKYFDINFPLYDEDGSELTRYSIGWNIQTHDD